MEKEIEKLKAARALIARPGAWIQGDYALTADGGYPQQEDGSYAVCWCLMGVLGEVNAGNVCRYYLRKVINKTNISRWNDAPGRTQAEVIAAFDQAIALAEAA